MIVQRLGSTGQNGFMKEELSFRGERPSHVTIGRKETAGKEKTSAKVLGQG